MSSLTEFIEQQSHLHMALLMGSYGTERARPESDVDVAVSAGEPLTAEARLQLVRGIAEATHRSVDLIDLETVHGLMLKQALRHGKPLIPTRPATFEKLLKQMVYEQEDLSPQIQQAKKNRVEDFIHGF